MVKIFAYLIFDFLGLVNTLDIRSISAGVSSSLGSGICLNGFEFCKEFVINVANDWLLLSFCDNRCCNL